MTIGPPQVSDISLLVVVPVLEGVKYNSLNARLIPLAGTINKPISQNSLSTKVPLSATGTCTMFSAASCAELEGAPEDVVLVVHCQVLG